MMYVIDISLAVIFIITIIVAAKKGFAKSLLEVVAVLLAIGISYGISAPISEKIYDQYVEDKIIVSVEKQLDKSEIDAVGTAVSVKKVVDELPDGLVRIGERFGVDVQKISDDIDIDSISDENTIPTIVEKVAEPIALPVIMLIVFIISAIILSVVFEILAGLLARVFKLPLIGSVNRILGAVLGAIKGVFSIIIICLLLQTLFKNNDGSFGEAVTNSYIINLVDDLILSIK